ncbi:MAG: acyltransferase [Phycisphaeraceae bacterium]|nr:acyltransferase [Phycisphaeraceae bacterium]
MIKALKITARAIGYRLRYAGRRIEIAPGARIAWRGTLRTYGGGSIKIGQNCRIMDYAMIMTYGGHVEIGAYSTVNPFCLLYGHGGLKIGRGVRIAGHTVMIPANHAFDDLEKPIWQQQETRQGIEIGDDVWIGAGCRILDGVNIGPGCVIGAGTVVTKSLPAYAIAVGVPARIIGNRKDSQP